MTHQPALCQVNEDHEGEAGGGDEQAAPEENKVPFAFSKCKDVKAKGSSAFIAECLICGKKVC